MSGYRIYTKQGDILRYQGHDINTGERVTETVKEVWALVDRANFPIARIFWMDDTGCVLEPKLSQLIELKSQTLNYGPGAWLASQNLRLPLEYIGIAGGTSV